VVRLAIQWSGICDFDRAPFEARLGSFGIIPQYFGIDLQLTTATILAAFDTKVSSIPWSNCFVPALLMLSLRRLRSFGRVQ
jgi:hypothetical protein